MTYPCSWCGEGRPHQSDCPVQREIETEIVSELVDPIDLYSSEFDTLQHGDVHSFRACGCCIDCREVCGKCGEA